MGEFTDRYQALGMPSPDPATMCKGDCEGTGVYPLWGPCEESGHEAALWREAHARACSVRGRLKTLVTGSAGRYGIIRDLRWAFRRCDGYHFVTCPDCNGTGRRERRRA